MPSIEVISRFEVPKEDFFNFLLKSNNISRYISPFFTLEKISSKNSNIDLDTYFIQKFALLDSLQIYYKVKDIIQNEKISYSFDGLIKGTHNIQLANTGNSCVLRENIDVSLHNELNLMPINLFLSLFFQLDTCIKQLRLKSILYKELKIPLLNDLSNIRSYIVIDANLESINSFFEDLNKLALWLSPYLKLEKLESEDHTKNFLLSFIPPLFPSIRCTLENQEKNKIKINFENMFLKGKNIWSVLPIEKQFIIENSLEMEHIAFFMEFLWLILGNTLVKHELENWNKRLKEVAEKTNLSQHLELSLRPA